MLLTNAAMPEPFGQEPLDQLEPPPPLLVAGGLSRAFGRRVVLRDVSLALAPASALGLTGPNGAGKTVLLRLLAALDLPGSGSVRIGGIDSVHQAREYRRSVGYVSEEPMLYDGLTASQYLHFVGRTRGLGKQVRGVSVETLLQVVGLDDRAQRDVRALSPGERRRLALAGALMHEPAVLLLDDPLRGLDGYARLEQLEVLKELRRLGTTVLLAATRPEDVLDVCDRFAVLRDGALTWEGSAEDAARLASPQAAATMRVRVEVLEGLEPALTLLGQHRDVSELELDEDGQTVWFRFASDRDELSRLLPQLVRAGCVLAHFGVERRSPANAVANLFHEGVA